MNNNALLDKLNKRRAELIAELKWIDSLLDDAGATAPATPTEKPEKVKAPRAATEGTKRKQSTVVSPLTYRKHLKEAKTKAELIESLKAANVAVSETELTEDLKVLSERGSVSDSGGKLSWVSKK